MRILVTGGAGYIGSHTCVELLKNGHDIVVMDNYFNSSPKATQAIKELSGKDFAFYEYDMLDYDAMDKIFCENKIDAVIHFAGLKAVGESVEKPLLYYHTNITGTVNLLRVMEKHNVKSIVFSSSATVYGTQNISPFKEDAALSTINPYGYTKLVIENILKDVCAADKDFKAALLRYFNPIGAHESGLIGEKPNGIPNNLMPYITMVANGELPHLNIYGNDYDTKDGTGVRDYIHVSDLAIGHIKALEKLSQINGAEAYNLGTGSGSSVLDIINTFEKVNGIKIPYEIMPRRAGDIADCYADVTKAKNELGFIATHTLEDMCASSWNFTKNNN